MTHYWDSRYGAEGKIWGDEPSSTVTYALNIFTGNGVKTVLVPGSGYGRNAVILARAGIHVTGVEVSDEALKLADHHANLHYVCGSFLDVPVGQAVYDGIYCYNVLHLFRKNDREAFIERCHSALKPGGLAFFIVFSDQEASCGKGAMVEEGTYESKPGRFVHYFSDADLRDHFQAFEIVETGCADDSENHGEEGPHIHRVRYVLAKKRPAHEFDGVKYRQASSHQREWGDRLIDSLELKGNEYILDLGCGDGTTTAKLATLVPDGFVRGIDASEGMIRAAKPLERANLRFERLDINDLGFHSQFDVIFSNATLHWVQDHSRMLAAVYKCLRPGGRIRLNFAGTGNCQHFTAAVRQVTGTPEYSPFFRNFQWPWYMPGAEEYRRLVADAGFTDVVIDLQNADRTFTEDGLVRWIEQPSIVPFMPRISDESMKKSFLDAVVRETLARTSDHRGGYFETFRRIDVRARK